MSISSSVSSTGVVYFYDSAVNVTTAWTLVTAINVVNRRGYALFDIVNRGANALSNLRIARSLTEGMMAAGVANVDYNVLQKTPTLMYRQS